MQFICHIPKFPLSYRFFHLTVTNLPLLTGTMHQICCKFWNEGSQPELISTLGIWSFFLLKTSLAALICADGTSFFTPVRHNAIPDQKQGYCPGQGCGGKASWRKANSLVRTMSSLPPVQHCNLHPTLGGHMQSTAGGQTTESCQELHLGHEMKKDIGAAVVCSTNVEEFTFIHYVPRQKIPR